MAERDALVGRIAAAFPELAFSNADLIESGDDHQIVLLDGEWVFRFPRTVERERLFRVELGVLSALRGRILAVLPDYRFLPPSRDFGGYPLIEGEPLDCARFAALTAGRRDRILGELAQFLRAIHALSPRVITGEDAEPAREWTPAMWRDRYRQARRAEIYQSVEEALLARIDDFYDAFVDRPASGRESVIHGDLSGDHLLVGQESPLGIIDFGDACLGDPAYDFTFFFAWGEGPARRIAELYDRGRKDPGLLERARWSYARSRIEKLRRGRDEAVIAEVEKTLARLGI